MFKHSCLINDNIAVILIQPNKLIKKVVGICQFGDFEKNAFFLICTLQLGLSWKVQYCTSK